MRYVNDRESNPWLKALIKDDSPEVAHITVRASDTRDTCGFCQRTGHPVRFCPRRQRVQPQAFPWHDHFAMGKRLRTAPLPTDPLAALLCQCGWGPFAVICTQKIWLFTDAPLCLSMFTDAPLC